MGLLGAGKSLSLRQILSELGVEPGDRMATASVQEAVGALVINGKIEHHFGSVDEYQLTKSF